MQETSYKSFRNTSISPRPWGLLSACPTVSRQGLFLGRAYTNSARQSQIETKTRFSSPIMGAF